MADIQLIRGSNGNGPAVRPVVTAARSSGSLTIKVNSTTNLPPSFIGTWGKLNQDTGKLISSSIRDFYGTVNGADIDLVRMADGFTDDGNEAGDVIVIKPNTDWTHNLADVLLVSHKPDGTLKDDSVTSSALADNSVTTAKIANKAVKATKIDLATLQFVDANGWRVTEGVKRTYRKIVSYPSASGIDSLVPAPSTTTSLPSGKSNTQVEIESVTPSSNTISYLYASAVTEPGLVRVQVRNVSGSTQNIPTTKIVIKLVDA